jgi:hypothetical protein
MKVSFNKGVNDLILDTLILIFGVIGIVCWGEGNSPCKDLKNILTNREYLSIGNAYTFDNDIIEINISK